MLSGITQTKWEAATLKLTATKKGNFEIKLRWRNAPVPPALKPGDVHVWSAELNQNSASVRKLANLLSPDELERSRSFHFQQDRDGFITGRGILRIILAGYLGEDPTNLEFRYSSFGKPSLLFPANSVDLKFNMAHSRRVALVAVNWDRQIGIDLEYIRPVKEVGRIAHSLISAEEKTKFDSLGRGDQVRAFFEYWTRREAIGKATGDGLTSRPDVSQQSMVTTDRTSTHNGRSRQSRIMSVRSLAPATDYLGALAVDGSWSSLECYRWAGCR